MEGGKKKQNGGLIRDQSLRPTDTLIRVYYNQIDRLLKDIQADKAQRVSSSQTTSLPKLQSCTDQDNAWVLFIDRVAWPPSGRSCEAEHTLDGELGCLAETCAPGLQPRAHCILHIIPYYFLLNLHNQGLQPRAHCTLHIIP